MRKNTFTIKRAIALWLSMILFVLAVPQNVLASTVSGGDAVTVQMPVSTEYAGENYQVCMKIDAQWEKHYNASVTITNTGEASISNWNLSFQSMDEIENIWNGVVYEHNEGTYIIKNAGYNGTIAVGESITFGFTAVYEENYALPGEFLMLGTAKEAKEEKYSVVYKVASDWGSGYSSTISITNASDAVIEDWGLEFSFDRTIDSIWNAVIELQDENKYVLKNAGYNRDIGINETIVIGFNGNDSNTGLEPYDFVLTGASLETAEDAVEYIELADGTIEAEYMHIIIYPNLLLRNEDVDNVLLADDFDEDGLNLIEEYNYGTNPFRKDTDADGLTEYEEIYQYGTKPLAEDTDEDGMTDGTEVSCGLDPLKKDTDEDGIPDGEEMVTQQVRIDPIGRNVSGQTELEMVGTLPSVEITGQGDYSTRLSVEKVEHNAVLLGIHSLVGTPYDFVHSEEFAFESSTLTFAISEEILKEHKLENLAIVWYNEEDNILEFRETSYNPADNTISAQVDHYSIYMVVDTKQYLYDTDWENTESTLESGKADVVFVVDTTGSMEEEIRNVRNNIQTFVADLEENHIDIRLGLVEYKDIYRDGAETTISYGWYTDVPEFQSKLAWLRVDGGGGDGPETAVDALDCARNMEFRPGVRKYIILLTDANYHDGTLEDNTLTLAEEVQLLAEDGIIASVVTHPAFFELYGGVAAETDGITADIYTNFATALVPLIEKMGEQVNDGCWVRLSDGSVVCLDADPTLGDPSIDTDEDGIPDLLELKEETLLILPESGNVVNAWKYRSNPSLSDTDGDQFTDANDPQPKQYNIAVSEVYGNVLKLNTGAVYSTFGMDIMEFYKEYYHNRDDANKKDRLEAMKSMLDLNRQKYYTVEEMVFLCGIDINGVKDCIDPYSASYKKRVFEKFTGEECTLEKAEERFSVPSEDEYWQDYFLTAAAQIAFGKYSEKQNTLGTLGEIGLAFTGLDVIQDVRDLSHDVIHWENNWEHVGETALDGVALFPVVGILSKSDEVMLLLKRGENLFELRVVKRLDDILTVLDDTKFVKKSQELLNTAGSVLKEMSAELYYRILNCCEGVPAYRLAYAGAGGYGNPMILAFSDYVDDLSYISRVSPETANDVITEVAQASGKSSDEIQEIAEEAIEEGRKKIDELVTNVEFRHGELYETFIEISGHRIEALAEVEVVGDKLILKDIAIYSTEGDIPNAIGYSEFVKWLNIVKEQAKNQGFKQLQIMGQRVQNSSSANQGSVINHIFILE